MSTRITSGGPSPNVAVTSTAYRSTPAPARTFNSLLNGGAQAVIQGAEAAAQRLPGGPEVVAAVRDGAAPPVASGYESATGAYVANAPPGSGAAAGNGSIEGALARQTQDNLYYLGLQQRIQDETRHFQAVSNVLKTQHDSVKNAIGNLR